MTYEKRQVMVCNGIREGAPCDLVIQKNEAHITLVMRATRSDLPRGQYVGLERYLAEKQAGLRKEVHLHPSCMLPGSMASDLFQHALTVTEWPELTEKD